MEKLRTNCKLSIQRMIVLRKKKCEMLSRIRREIADLIAAGRIESARIKTEHLIQEDYIQEALEVLENYLEIISNRSGLICAQANVDEGLAQTIITLIWSAPRLNSEVPELAKISQFFLVKYGRRFHDASLSNSLHLASPKIVNCLSVQPPSLILVDKYLKAIADSYKLSFTPEYVEAEQEMSKIESQLLQNNSNNQSSKSNSSLSLNKSNSPIMTSDSLISFHSKSEESSKSDISSHKSDSYGDVKVRNEEPILTPKPVKPLNESFFETPQVSKPTPIYFDSLYMSEDLQAQDIAQPLEKPKNPAPDPLTTSKINEIIDFENQLLTRNKESCKPKSSTLVFDAVEAQTSSEDDFEDLTARLNKLKSKDQ